jgi:hypothetical protein
MNTGGYQVDDVHVSDLSRAGDDAERSNEEERRQ